MCVRVNGELVCVSVYVCVCLCILGDIRLLFCVVHEKCVVVVWKEGVWCKEGLFCFSFHIV